MTSPEGCRRRISKRTVRSRPPIFADSRRESAETVIVPPASQACSESARRTRARGRGRTSRYVEHLGTPAPRSTQSMPGRFAKQAAGLAVRCTATIRAGTLAPNLADLEET